LPHSTPARKPATTAVLAAAVLTAQIAAAAPAASAKTYVPCSKGGGVTVELKIKPRRCDFTYLHNPLALAGRAKGLEWRGWGRRVARARGTGIALHADEQGRYARFPVRVRLSRRRDCGGFALYTRVTMVDPDDRRTWSVPPGSC
jgi:hypothetical protein